MAKIGSIPIYANDTARDAVTDVEDGDICFVVGTGLCIRISGVWEVIALVSDLS